MPPQLPQIPILPVRHPDLRKARDSAPEWQSLEEGLCFVGSARRLFLENIISLAAYMIPARILVFKDDDFFLGDTERGKMVKPLESDCLLAVVYSSEGLGFSLRWSPLRKKVPLELLSLTVSPGALRCCPRRARYGKLIDSRRPASMDRSR